MKFKLKTYEGFVNETLKREMKLPEEVLRISDLYRKAGKKLFVVGGAVRDFLQDKAPKDFDLATDATPDESLAILKPHFKTMEVGKAFGVVVATMKNGDQYEVATFRSDVGKGRRPDSVEFTTIEKDVLRRDLTINALFYDIQKKEIVDLVGGEEDIRNRRIRTVGNPRDRFEEDPLRKLRAIRFATRMGGELDAETYAALREDPSLQGVSPERIRDEFVKILATAHNLRDAINLLHDLKFFPYIFPNLKVETDEVVEKNLVATLALLVRNNDPNSVNRELNKLTYTREEVSAIVFLLKLQNLSQDNAYELKRMQERSSLRNDPKTVEEFASRVIPIEDAKAFASYEISTQGQDLESEGFTGVELGKKMKELETQKYIEHHKKYLL